MPVLIFWNSASWVSPIGSPWPLPLPFASAVLYEFKNMSVCSSCSALTALSGQSCFANVNVLGDGDVSIADRQRLHGGVNDEIGLEPNNEAMDLDWAISIPITISIPVVVPVVYLLVANSGADDTRPNESADGEGIGIG